MRRVVAAAFAAAALTTLAPSPASASLTCSPLGPVPGWGPVCQVKCLLGAMGPVGVPDVNIKDPVGTVVGTVAPIVTVMCPD